MTCARPSSRATRRRRWLGCRRRYMAQSTGGSPFAARPVGLRRADDAGDAGGPLGGGRLQSHGCDAAPARRRRRRRRCLPPGGVDVRFRRARDHEPEDALELVREAGADGVELLVGDADEAAEPHVGGVDGHELGLDADRAQRQVAVQPRRDYAGVLAPVGVQALEGELGVGDERPPAHLERAVPVRHGALGTASAHVDVRDGRVGPRSRSVGEHPADRGRQAPGEEGRDPHRRQQVGRVQSRQPTGP